jgi:signal transduction histidine kinase
LCQCKAKVVKEKKLWLPLLPLWLSSLVLLVLLLGAPGSPRVLQALGAAAAGGLGLVEGLLLASGRRAGPAEQRARRLESIYEVIRKAGGSLDLQEVLDAVTRITAELTGVRGCSIKLWDPATGRMRVRSMAGIVREAADLSVDVAENLYHRSLMEGNPVLVEDALVKDFPEVDDQTESLICVPLRHEARVLGALCVYGQRGGRLTREMISLFTILGDLASLSIANASVFEQLKRLDEAKSWFLLQASHELRSPLASVQSILRTLLQGLLGELPPEQRALLERVEVRLQGLTAGVNDLLILAKGRARLLTEERQRVDLCRLLQEQTRFYGELAREKGVRLEVSCGEASAVLLGRREGLEAVVSNLLSNAIKYTPAGGEVRLSLAGEGQQIELAVSDTGIGIPEADRPNLFREFFRAGNARALDETGTGLGLAIVRSIVEQHGGTIDVESSEGRGTTFRVRLPRPQE